MNDVKFVEDDSVKENCKMLFRFTFTGENYQSDDANKNEVIRQFMNLLKKNVFANEIEMVHPEFDKGNGKVIILNITFYNGNLSKNIIQSAISKANLEGLINKE